MKKAFIILLSLILILSTLVGCGSDLNSASELEQILKEEFEAGDSFMDSKGFFNDLREDQSLSGELKVVSLNEDPSATLVIPMEWEADYSDNGDFHIYMSENESIFVGHTEMDINDMSTLVCDIEFPIQNIKTISFDECLASTVNGKNVVAGVYREEHDHAHTGVIILADINDDNLTEIIIAEDDISFINEDTPINEMINKAFALIMTCTNYEDIQTISYNWRALTEDEIDSRLLRFGCEEDHAYELSPIADTYTDLYYWYGDKEYICKITDAWELQDGHDNWWKIYDVDHTWAIMDFYLYAKAEYGYREDENDYTSEYIRIYPQTEEEILHYLSTRCVNAEYNTITIETDKFGTVYGCYDMDVYGNQLCEIMININGDYWDFMAYCYDDCYSLENVIDYILDGIEK